MPLSALATRGSVGRALWRVWVGQAWHEVLLLRYHGAEPDFLTVEVYHRTAKHSKAQRTCAHVQAHTRTRTHPCTHPCTHPHTHARTPTHARTCRCTTVHTTTRTAHPRTASTCRKMRRPPVTRSLCARRSVPAAGARDEAPRVLWVLTALIREGGQPRVCAGAAAGCCILRICCMLHLAYSLYIARLPYVACFGGKRRRSGGCRRRSGREI
jgi:hypothetical protein